MNTRFELDSYKYKNVLIFDNTILLTSNFYMSVEDFKYRAKNSKNDKLVRFDDVISFEHLSIGTTIFLNLKNGQEKLEFYSEEQKNDFLKLILDKDPKIFEVIEKSVNKEKIKLKDKITFTLTFSIIFIIIITVIYINEGLKGIFKKILFLIGYIIAVISTYCYINQSKFIKYKNTTADNA